MIVSMFLLPTPSARMSALGRKRTYRSHLISVNDRRDALGSGDTRTAHAFTVQRPNHFQGVACMADHADHFRLGATTWPLSLANQ